MSALSKLVESIDPRYLQMVPDDPTEATRMARGVVDVVERTSNSFLELTDRLKWSRKHRPTIEAAGTVANDAARSGEHLLVAIGLRHADAKFGPGQAPIEDVVNAVHNVWRRTFAFEAGTVIVAKGERNQPYSIFGPDDVRIRLRESLDVLRDVIDEPISIERAAHSSIRRSTWADDRMSVLGDADQLIIRGDVAEEIDGVTNGVRGALRNERVMARALPELREQALQEVEIHALRARLG